MSGNSNSNEIIRSKRNGCFKVVSNKYWGQYLKQVDDPLSNIDSDAGLLVLADRLSLVENFPKIPADLWKAIVVLYFEYATQRQLEVHVLFMRDIEGRRWKALVPKQEVTGGSTDAEFQKCCDILTGEEYIYPDDLEEEWVAAGTSHSHGTMMLNEFSGQDDDDELSTPGAHILVSSIDKKNNTYRTKASVVQGGKRYYLDLEDLVDTTRGSTTKYHPKVKEYISEEVLKNTARRNSQAKPYSNPFRDDLWGGLWNGGDETKRSTAEHSAHKSIKNLLNTAGGRDKLMKILEELDALAL